MSIVSSKIPREVEDEIVRRRESGESYRRIGQQTGRSPDAVRYHCLRLGAFAPGGIGAPRVATRGKGFTEAEDKRMLELSTAGVRPNGIAAEIGRPRSSVTSRLLVLAAREALREER